jgi:hypothetical protein
VAGPESPEPANLRTGPTGVCFLSRADFPFEAPWTGSVTVGALAWLDEPAATGWGSGT